MWTIPGPFSSTPPAAVRVAARTADGVEREPLEMLDELLAGLTDNRQMALAYTPTQAAAARLALADMRRLLAAATILQTVPPGTVDRTD